MSVYKDEKTGRYTAFIRYEDWQGERRAKKKEGFKTKREAKKFETEFLAKVSNDITMGFGCFIDKYLKDLKPSIKPTTYSTKVNIINTHIRPYFEDKALSDITSSDVLQWQNEILLKTDQNGRRYAETFLRTIQNQMTAIFNHAVRFYDLPKNPCSKLKKMGKSEAGEMEFWTVDEFNQFIDAIKDKPISYYAYEILFWTGIRMGELMALEPRDFDIENGKMYITKNLQVVDGNQTILTPKTDKGNRVVHLPKFLCEEMEEFFDSIYGLKEDSRLFEVSKSFLHHEMDRGCKKSGVKRIHVHGLRHSSCAALVSLGFTPYEIAKRLGHDSATITEKYAHLYPSVQDDMVEALDRMHKNASKGGGLDG